MQLIVITPEQDAANETDVVNSLFAAGLQRLHLRKPAYSARDHVAYLDSIDTQFHSRIVLNSCFDLLDAFKLGGVHLNSMIRDSEGAKRLMDELSALFISTSFHSWQEVRQNTFPYNYVFISPVFDSISKAGYKAAIDLGGGLKIRKECVQNNLYCPGIIGLGGVGLQQIETLYTFNFDGAALLGSIWQSADPVTAFTNMLQITSRLADH